ncbi:MAG: UDP-N-acetylmuramoyl-L-alanine--D-glutamate ligase [Epsilonproteobacteria bacterium]|nr:UDP-N-acetylmuramoyl-L-alanine--D-glutamate ligase [Campylobacterota bacterium]
MSYRIGIIGFGIVGKSALNFFSHHVSASCMSQLPGYDIKEKMIQLRVWDKRLLGADELMMIAQANAEFVCGQNQTLSEFIAEHDAVFVSASVDVSAYLMYAYKMINELDLFSACYKQPVVGVTGSVGKTSVTALLAQLISGMSFLGCKRFKAHAVGNIGVGLLDLISSQGCDDLCVAELSSFQLELSSKSNVDIAIWTNFYPNHLDRHRTIKDYFDAKGSLLLAQKEHQVALLSAQLLEDDFVKMTSELLARVKSHICFFDATRSGDEFFQLIPLKDYSLLYINDGIIWYECVKDGVCAKQKKLCPVAFFPGNIFIANILVLVGALYFLGADFDFFSVQRVHESLHNESLRSYQQHRLELICSPNGVDFYNDSKATIAQATQAAVERLSHNKRPLIVILGGTDKGVKRGWLGKWLAGNPFVKRVYCFGQSCADFEQVYPMKTLEQVVESIANDVQLGDQVLFSPGGASFDQYTNYMERGNAFKELVWKKFGVTK